MRFVNELGNQIEIGVNTDGELVEISIVGPHSETHNTITRQEAAVLHRLIGNSLPTKDCTANHQHTETAMHVLELIGTVFAARALLLISYAVVGRHLTAWALVAVCVWALSNVVVKTAQVAARGSDAVWAVLVVAASVAVVAL